MLRLLSRRRIGSPPGRREGWRLAATWAVWLVCGLQSGCFLLGYDGLGPLIDRDAGPVDAGRRGDGGDSSLDAGEDWLDASGPSLDAGDADSAVAASDAQVPVDAGPPWWDSVEPIKACVLPLPTCMQQCTFVDGRCLFECSASTCSSNCAALTQCRAECSGTNCENYCYSNADCSVACSAKTCDNTCAANADCQVDCTKAGNCATQCLAGSSCEADCRGSAQCSMNCANTAQCLLYCGALTCGLTCVGERRECPGGVFTCNRECP
jgi:hypothetical protein